MATSRSPARAKNHDAEDGMEETDTFMGRVTRQVDARFASTPLKTKRRAWQLCGGMLFLLVALVFLARDSTKHAPPQAPSSASASSSSSPPSPQHRQTPEPPSQAHQDEFTEVQEITPSNVVDVDVEPKVEDNDNAASVDSDDVVDYGDENIKEEKALFDALQGEDQDQDAATGTPNQEANDESSNDNDDDDEDEEDCTSETLTLLRETRYPDYLIRRADCGLGYNVSQPNPKATTKVGVLVKSQYGLTGCPKSGEAGCPLFPKCTFVHSDGGLRMGDVDVLVIPSYWAASLVTRVVPKTRPYYKVLFWREAFWAGVSYEDQKKFDFNMGVHVNSEIVNPPYIRRPHLLMKTNPIFPFRAFPERTQFALSITSDCVGFRENYIDHLSDYLGPARVHRYGDCGNRNLPPKPVRNAAKVISQYKFYLAFENTIQPGYVTEKLFTVLNMQILPVYLGAPDAPNITTTPCYLRANHFPSPRELAQHLLFLNDNPHEYAKYHAWRFDTTLFDPVYLDLVARKTPGKYENSLHKRFDKMTRRSNCCRLCNLDYVRAAAQRRRDGLDQTGFVKAKMGDEQIQKLFFQRGWQRPGPGHIVNV